MGKKKVGESDSDNSESDDSDAENEKSVVTENGNHSDSSKDTSSASVSALTHPADNHSGGSSESGSEEEKEIANEGPIGLSATPSGSSGEMTRDGPMERPSADKVSLSAEQVSTAKIVVEKADGEIVTEQLPSTITSVEPECPCPATIVPELHGASDGKAVSSDEGVSRNSSASEVPQPLNLDDINSATELEVLGMEKLKCELQARGLKCGGTLQERAARLFLLKTTPLEKLPKKLLAKK